MPAQTKYIVQSFYKQGRRPMADQAREMRNAEAAIDGAKRLAERKAGVVAYSVDYDPQAEMTGDPKVLFRAGDLPPEMAQ